MANFKEPAGTTAVIRSAAFGQQVADAKRPQHNAMSKRQFGGGSLGEANKEGTAVSGSEDFAGEVADVVPEVAEAAALL
jgi:hypothetical protein